MNETVALYPAPIFAHLVSMVELGKLILQHQPCLTIVVFVPSMPSDHSTATSSSSYISDLSQTGLPISFLPLPPLQATVFDSVAMNALNVLDALKTLSSTSTILALVTSAPHENLNTHIPTFCYFTSCASALAFFLYLPTFHNQTAKSFQDLTETPLNFPGLPHLSASYVPEPVLNRENPSYDFFLSFATHLLKSKGLIVNTFNLLEPSAIEAITDGACVPNDQTPPIFCIGSLITSAKDHFIASSSHDDEASNCVAWLDKQPSESVVFLCFGSKGVFTEAQIKEIAIGLERSNHRFLWVVKSPLGLDTEPKLEELLPHGFLERTKEKGLVLKYWAPQNAILRHESVAGFVTHCGWNSVLEAVSYGVPMVAWPLYAEQHMNSVVLVKEMKVAIPIREELARDGSKEGMIVSADGEKSEAIDGIGRRESGETEEFGDESHGHGCLVFRWVLFHCIYRISKFLEAWMSLL